VTLIQADRNAMPNHIETDEIDALDRTLCFRARRALATALPSIGADFARLARQVAPQPIA